MCFGVGNYIIFALKICIDKNLYFTMKSGSITNLYYVFVIK